jgi:hypothetical protein
VEALSGLVTACNVLLAVAIGMRLLRLGAQSGGPERWLGVYFLGSSVFGTVLSGFVYMAFASPSLVLPDPWLRTFHALELATGGAGLFGIYMFTWRTFRPDDAWARSAVIAGGAVLLGSLVWFGISEGFQVAVLNGPSYWIGVGARELALVWMAIESVRYWGLLRRRLRLGLSDPLVTNRFLLWGLFAAVVILMGAADPLARVWYCRLADSTTTWDPELGRPIIVVVMALTSALGILSAGTLFLTFFPTPGYRRWVLGRRAPAA